MQRAAVQSLRRALAQRDAAAEELAARVEQGAAREAACEVRIRNLRDYLQALLGDQLDAADVDAVEAGRGDAVNMARAYAKAMHVPHNFGGGAAAEQAVSVSPMANGSPAVERRLQFSPE